MTTGRIGIDLGGSKIEALFLDADGNEVERERVATPPPTSPRSTSSRRW
jgi:fructokinase